MSLEPHAAEDIILETQAAHDEKSKLKKHFGRFDMLFFLICTLVGVDTLGAVASNGPEGFTWLLVLAAFFFIPYALLTAELGAAFTDEGGAYVWTKLAWGRFVAAVNSVLYWLSNPVWMGGLLCITAVTTFNTFFGDLGTVGEYLFSLAFIWFGVWAAILSFGIGKWIPTLGAWARILLLAFFTFSVILYAVKHGLHAPGHQRVLAQLHAVHRAGAGAVLQLRRLRAAERGRRRDEGPAEGRPVHRAARGVHVDRALRRPDPRDHHGAAVRSDHRPGRLHRRHEDGLHRLRRRGHQERRRAQRRGRVAREHQRRAVHPRAALQRHDLADGRRPLAGRRRLRRRRPAHPRARSRRSTARRSSSTSSAASSRRS